MNTIYSRDESDRLQLLNNVKHHLWIAGMHRSKIRPLHRQVVLERDIVISEDISLHFVTRDGKAIFIKPFPRCLLQAESTNLVESVRNDNITRGFIWTYISMIQTESDLRVALENYLLPRELRKSEIKSKRDMEVAFENWVNIKNSWKRTILGVMPEDFLTFHNRFDRGELRLDRLNIIVCLLGFRIRGYQRLDTTYGSYFQSFFAVISITLFAFISIALSAFQVAMSYSNVSIGLAIVGYWFSVAMMLFLLAIVVAFCLCFAVVFTNNLVFALGAKDKR